MSIETLPGIISKMITSSRLTTRVLFSGPEDGVPVLFLHGNHSSATWWEETMLALPPGFRGIAPDLRGYGDADYDKLIDSTRGMGDWVDDAFALLDALEIEEAHAVGSSLGGVVVWRMIADAPARLLTVTQVSPGSPYGFGATKDLDGMPTNEDFSGSGGGLINPEFLKRLTEKDTSAESPFSPRSALRTLLVMPGFSVPREDALVNSMLSTHVGDKIYSGDSTQSPHWPYVAPGVWGPNNALSPKYVRADVPRLLAADPKPPVLWVRGAQDLSVSDTASADMGTLGKMGLVPGWPGEDVYPSQPMLGQTRAVLDNYAARGGRYEEVVIEDCRHVAYIEKPEEFNAVFHPHIQG